MKKLIKAMVLIFILNISFKVSDTQLNAQQTVVSFQVFYDELSPYGEWIDYPGHGYAWVPRAGVGFRPYSTSGHWIYTDCGWTWVSDYAWGWAPFHYGRWNYDPSFGWIWIPGTEWAPAWVAWRRHPGYYGWAPLAPGININVVIGGHYNIPDDQWMFVRERYIGHRHLNRYFLNQRENGNYIRHSTFINNTHVDNRSHVTYLAGPDRMEVQRVTGRPVAQVAVREYDRPGHSMSKEQLRIYRPEIRQNKGVGRAAPLKVNNSGSPRQIPERNAVNQTQYRDRRIQSNPAPGNSNPSFNRSGNKPPENIKGSPRSGNPQPVIKQGNKQPENIKGSPRGGNPQPVIKQSNKPPENIKQSGRGGNPQPQQPQRNEEPQSGRGRR